MLGMTVRTLQRNLHEEETSFSPVLNRAREQLATRYLSNPRTRMKALTSRNDASPE
jgi:hypothetical protein